MEPSAIIAVNAILGIASLVTSVTGFGYGLVATPFMCLMLSPSMAVPVVLMSWLPLALLLVYDCFKEMNLSRIGRLYICAMIGVPAGAYGLSHAEDDTMRIFIGAITLLAAVSMLRRPRGPLRREPFFLCAAGLLSGVIGGGTGITGPPVVLLGLKQQWEHPGFRADLIGYFFVLHASMLILFRNVGLLEQSTLSLSLWSLPGVLVGYFAGMRLKNLISPSLYRRLAIGIVGLGGVLAVLFR
jgi:uncharacterized membrane protein YfcA